MSGAKNYATAWVVMANYVYVCTCYNSFNIYVFNMLQKYFSYFQYNIFPDIINPVLVETISTNACRMQ